MTNEEAIATLKYQHDYGQMEQDVRDALAMAIKALEQPERTGRWIRVEDEIPKESGLYLVTEKAWFGNEIHTRYFNRRRDGGFWSGHVDIRVIAWMDLPEPYQEGGDT